MATSTGDMSLNEDAHTSTKIDVVREILENPTEFQYSPVVGTYLIFIQTPMHSMLLLKGKRVQ